MYAGDWQFETISVCMFVYIGDYKHTQGMDNTKCTRQSVCVFHQADVRLSDINSL